MALAVSAIATACALTTSPSLSMTLATATGPVLVQWALQKTIPKCGNHYYVYQVLTNSTPDDIKESANSPEKNNSFMSKIFDASSMAVDMADTAINSGLKAGSYLIVAVTESGQVMYRMSVAGSCNYVKNIFSKEDALDVNNLEEWEVVEVDSNTFNLANNDEQLKTLFSDWFLIQKKDASIEECILNEGGDDLSNDDDWEMINCSDNTNDSCQGGKVSRSEENQNHSKLFNWNEEETNEELEESFIDDDCGEFSILEDTYDSDECSGLL